MRKLWNNTILNSWTASDLKNEKKILIRFTSIQKIFFGLMIQNSHLLKINLFLTWWLWGLFVLTKLLSLEIPAGVTWFIKLGNSWILTVLFSSFGFVAIALELGKVSISLELISDMFGSTKSFQRHSTFPLCHKSFLVQCFLITKIISRRTSSDDNLFQRKTVHQRLSLINAEMARDGKFLFIFTLRAMIHARSSSSAGTFKRPKIYDHYQVDIFHRAFDYSSRAWGDRESARQCKQLSESNENR